MVKQIIRALVAVSLTLGCSVVLLDSFDFGSSGLAGLFVLGTCAFGLLYTLVSRVRYGTWLSAWGAIFVASPLAAYVVFGTTVRLQHTESFRRGDVIVAALDSYQASHGSYPETLDALRPQFLAVVPDSAMGVLHHVPFHYAPDGLRSFSLGFASPAFMHCSLSSDRAWYCDD